MSRVCKISYIILLKQYGVSKSDLARLTEEEQMLLWAIFNKYKKMLKIGDHVCVDCESSENEEMRVSLLRFRKQTYFITFP